MPNRRRTIWADDQINSTVGGGAQTIRELVQNPDNFQRAGSTIARQIIDLYVAKDPAATVIGIIALDFGIGLVSQDAAAAGAVPDVNVENDKPVGGHELHEHRMTPCLHL